MILYYILVPFAWLLWHIGFRIHVEGRENLKKVQTKGYILAPTHVSAIDPVFIAVTRWGGTRIRATSASATVKSSGSTWV